MDSISAAYHMIIIFFHWRKIMQDFHWATTAPWHEWCHRCFYLSIKGNLKIFNFWTSIKYHFLALLSQDSPFCWYWETYIERPSRKSRRIRVDSSFFGLFVTHIRRRCKTWRWSFNTNTCKCEKNKYIQIQKVGW